MLYPNAMSQPDREILWEQMSKINMSRRLLRHIDGPKHLRFYELLHCQMG